uniref:(northern house mosquito) hypothetical protein n=1 Tax=Culex pipiens TaxID=7175 RepID=A0A8D8KTG1_CULPI
MKFPFGPHLWKSCLVHQRVEILPFLHGLQDGFFLGVHRRNCLAVAQLEQQPSRSCEAVLMSLCPPGQGYRPRSLASEHPSNVNWNSRTPKLTQSFWKPD